MVVEVMEDIGQLGLRLLEKLDVESTTNISNQLLQQLQANLSDFFHFIFVSVHSFVCRLKKVH